MDSLLGLILIIAFGHIIFAPIADRISEAWERYTLNRRSS